MLITLEESFHGSTRRVSINNRNFDVKIPKGARSGTKLRLAGAGPTSPAGQKSDVFLVIQFVATPQFEIKKGILTTQVEISPAIAAPHAAT